MIILLFLKISPVSEKKGNKALSDISCFSSGGSVCKYQGHYRDIGILYLKNTTKCSF